MTATVPLRTGATMPVIGLGVYRAGHGPEAQAAIRKALELGYRHIDTASIYGNEADVGQALRDSGLDPSEVFVTSKLWNADQGTDSARRGFDSSLSKLGFDSLDLYLLHWPVPTKRLDSWRTLVELQSTGRVKAIGVSNYQIRHLKEIQDAGLPLPAVNQIEASPFFQRRELRQWCAQHEIVVQAYSPLTKGQKLRHPVLTTIAKQQGCSPAQVLLAWGLARDMVILPKSTDPGRQRENLEADQWTLTASQLEALDALEEGLATGWDPRDQD